MSERMRGISAERYGIINPYNTVWSPNTFDSESAALAHLKAFWRGTKCDISEFKIAKVRVTIEPIEAAPSEPARGASND